jgi:hypothetical protein
MVLAYCTDIRHATDLVSRTSEREAQAMIRDPGCWHHEDGGPGSAAHHFMLRCARDTRSCLRKNLSPPPQDRIYFRPALLIEGVVLSGVG